MQTVEQWLEQLGLSQYAQVFAENDVDLEAMRFLGEGDLERLGVSLGNRKKLLNAIARLDSGAQTPDVTERPPADERSRTEAERRQLTVLFCDLVGSTQLATNLDPELLRDLMQAYQRACGAVIARYEGHVAQYLGDGLMVYFGWPRAHEDDAERAVRASLEIIEAVKRVPAHAPLQVRVGIATGPVVVGETGGGDASVPKLAVGETPNLAARLQGLAGSDEVVIAPSTRQLVGGVFRYADLGRRTLKGIVEPVRAWRVTGLGEAEGRFEAARSEVALTPLVGRDEEAALLLQRWREARAGAGQVVLIGGEPGIGKSRLSRVLRERLSAERCTLRRYQCSPYHVNSALYPVIEQLERAAGFSREDTSEQKLDKLEAMLAASAAQPDSSAALFAAMLSLPVERYAPLNLSPRKQKEKTLEAVVAQIETLAQRQPVLMIYEDVHWIDATSEEALDLLVPRLRGLPVLLIVTHRPEYSPRWSEQAHATVLGLSRLGRRQASELVTKLTDGKALPPEVLEQILAHTDGVPLFVEELTKSILESNLLREQGDRYVLDGPLPALAVPTTLRDSLIARLGRLAPVREVAQVGACIGREFAHDLLAAVSPLKGAKLLDALEQLTGSGLLFRRGMPPDATYTFKHALVQDAAYDSLLKSRRALLHGQIAEALGTSFPERVANEPEVLAHHHTLAGDPAAAIPLWRKAGELALARVALPEAVGHLHKGLALIDQVPPSAQRDETELSIREPLNAAWTGLRGWHAQEVGANAAAILEIARKQGKPQGMLIGFWGVWANAASQGRIAQSLEWAQRMLAEGERWRDRDLQVFGHQAAVVSHYYLGNLLEAREARERATALYDPQRALRWMQLTGHDVRTTVDSYAVHCDWMLGYPDRAVRMSDEKDAHARQLGHAFNLGFALSFGAAAFDHRCEPTPFLARLAEADRLARDQGIPFLYRYLIPVNEAIARLRAGEWSKSVSVLRPLIESMPAEGATRIPYMKACLAEAVALQGDLDAALRLLDECLVQIERPGWQERVHLAEILRLKGWMLIRQGRTEEAELQLRASIDWARRQQAKSWELRSSTTLAELLRKRGQRDAARGLLFPVYHWFTEGFDTRDLIVARGLLEALQ